MVCYLQRVKHTRENGSDIKNVIKCIICQTSTPISNLAIPCTMITRATEFISRHLLPATPGSEPISKVLIANWFYWELNTVSLSSAHIADRKSTLQMLKQEIKSIRQIGK